MCEKSGWVHGAIRVSRCRTWGFFFPAKPTSTHTYGKKSWISMSGHETRSTGSLNSGKTPADQVSCPDTEIRVFSEFEFPWTGFHLRVRTWNPVTGTCIPEKLGSPCQDMKPGPQGKLMYYYFYPGSDLREISRFLWEIECIEFECNKFVLVLVQIDLIHFEH